MQSRDTDRRAGRLVPGLGDSAQGPIGIAAQQCIQFRFLVFADGGLAARQRLGGQGALRFVQPDIARDAGEGDAETLRDLGLGLALLQEGGNDSFTQVNRIRAHEAHDLGTLQLQCQKERL